MAYRGIIPRKQPAVRVPSAGNWKVNKGTEPAVNPTPIARPRHSPIPHRQPRQYSLTEPIIREPGVKIRSRGPQVQYGKATLVNPNAVYPNNDKGSPEYWQSVDMGYKPTYWEDPRHVAVAYQQLKSLLPGETPPEWMDRENIEAAYKYLSYANGEESWTNWKYLAPDDPGREYLPSIPPPPLEEVLQPDQYQQIQFNRMLNLAPEERDPQELAKLTAYHQNILAQYDTYNQNQEFINQHTPGWMRLTQSIMDNPIAAGWAAPFALAGINKGG